ncbi:MAG TPA: efflux RND transporter periplasmic adaptor subunit [Hyphomicrobium sp.]|nr:efflux RND transporter periplasmic adaptor subunit [Hyphomicrobium sp.]
MTASHGTASKLTVFALATVACAGAAYYVLGPEVFRSATTQQTPAIAAPNAHSTNGAHKSGSVAVEVASVKVGTASNDIRAIGSLKSDESVQVAPEISGRISEIVFQEGTAVKKNDILLKLDDALAAAEVADTNARLALADANNDRASALSRTGNVTGRGRDEAIANFETAKAAAGLAKTRLDKHVLVAPFDGITGVRNVSVGAFVNVGTALTNLEKIDFLKVDFKVPELYLDAVKVGQKIELSVDAVPGKKFDATIYAINPLLDVNGRALEIRARLENKDLHLRPGLFARIVIKGLRERQALMVPEAAVQSRGGDSFIFVVNDAKVIEKRVTLGQRANAEVEIVSGIDAQSRVVTAGQQKLRDGAEIEIIAPASDAARSIPAATERSTAIGGRG